MKKVNRKLSNASKGQSIQQLKQEQLQYDISKILDARKSEKGFEYLIRWEGYGPKHDSWIPESNLVGEWAIDEAEKFLIAKKSELMDVKIYQQKCTARLKILQNGKYVIHYNTMATISDKIQNSVNKNATTLTPNFKHCKKQYLEVIDEQENRDNTFQNVVNDYENNQDRNSLQIIPELQDFLCSFLNFSREYENKLTYQYDNFQGIDYGSMIYQTREEFVQGAYKQILKQFKTTKLYSEEVQQLPPHDIFKKAYWHPGKQDQSTLTCFITASNMVAGGALFDSPQKFHALYESRTHMSNKRKLEMPWEEGYCYKNSLSFLRPKYRLMVQPNFYMCLLGSYPSQYEGKYTLRVVGSLGDRQPGQQIHNLNHGENNLT
ncbi:hypothetical protein OXYTRIMIC_056 [Oxytricha trifallax]|uniref:Chromo domain-containing protein n=1 Tax=Oxytricha trifallax TaxID=1172189 RepID=A0A073HXI6_9SPIT|nr:hypothetical protein OXYTRIMIC_056 [Oxytricha trifallax]